MTYDEAGELIAHCINLWPNHVIPSMPDLKQDWHLALADIPYPAAQGALLWWTAEGAPFFPVPTQLRERAITLIEGYPHSESYAYRTGLDIAVRRALMDGRELDLLAGETPQAIGEGV